MVVNTMVIEQTFMDCIFYVFLERATTLSLILRGNSLPHPPHSHPAKEVKEEKDRNEEAKVKLPRFRDSMWT